MHASLAVTTIPAGYEDYRYVLEMRLSECVTARRLAVLMKNPSTASAERLDPTIGKVRAWALRHGFGLVRVVNLFALRATHPPALNTYPYAAIVGPENDAHILRAAADTDLLIAGWGNPNGIDPERYARRIAEVLTLLAPCSLHAVGAPTKLGHPRHALLWNGGAEVAHWSPALLAECGT